MCGLLSCRTSAIGAATGEGCLGAWPRGPSLLTTNSSHPMFCLTHDQMGSIVERLASWIMLYDHVHDYTELIVEGSALLIMGYDQPGQIHDYVGIIFK